MSASALDCQMMARAIQLAQRGRYGTSPNPRVGCVIARGETIIAEGWHQRAGEGHAEVNALAALTTGHTSANADGSACAEVGATGATAYVTLEPCSHQGRTGPCADALVASGVARVVVAISDPNPLVAGQGLAKLTAAGIDVEVGVLVEQALALNPGYIRRMQGGMPWLRMKSAMSLDGRTAMASGESYWITGPEARADVQRLRAQSCGIITGVETVLADDPALTVRPDSINNNSGYSSHSDPVWRQPLRVVLDSQLRTPPHAKLFKEGGDILIIGAEGAAPADKAEALRHAGAELATVAADSQGLDLTAVLKLLSERGCNEIMVEAGATISGAFLQADLVDEWFVYLAPTLMGHAGRPLMNWPMQSMAERQGLNIVDIRAVGRDWRIHCRPSA